MNHCDVQGFRFPLPSDILLCLPGQLTNLSGDVQLASRVNRKQVSVVFLRYMA